jgi:hypothetical protein
MGRLSGSDEDSAFLMRLRQNTELYIRFIDTFAPSLVGKSKWSKATTYNFMSATAFNELLSTSDETFLLLVLVNYAARWYAEAKKVSNCNVILLLSLKVNLLHCRSKQVATFRNVKVHCRRVEIMGVKFFRYAYLVLS